MVDIPERFAIRLTEYDQQALREIAGKNPHIPDVSGLMREALFQWVINATDENSKGKRLERVEKRTEEILERLISLGNKLQRKMADW